MIEGVIIKDLVSHGDARGFFRELIRGSDPFFAAGFGQLSHSLVEQGIIKAWHGHRVQTQWTYVIAGVLQIAIYDARQDSGTFGNKIEMLLGDGHLSRVYSMPPGVLHGYCCLTGPAHVLYVTSGEYDVSDEVRVPHVDPAIGHDWSRPVALSAATTL